PLRQRAVHRVPRANEIGRTDVARDRARRCGVVHRVAWSAIGPPPRRRDCRVSSSTQRRPPIRHRGRCGGQRLVHGPERQARPALRPAGTQTVSPTISPSVANNNTLPRLPGGPPPPTEFARLRHRPPPHPPTA